MKKISLILFSVLTLFGAGCSSSRSNSPASHVSITKPDEGQSFTQDKAYPIGGVITVEGDARANDYVTLFANAECIKTSDEQRGSGRANDQGHYAIAVTSVTDGTNTLRAMAASQEELEKIDPYACIPSQYVSEPRTFQYEGPKKSVPAKKK